MRKLYYIANVRLPTEKAHGIQIMEMCQAFAGSGVEVELVIPNRHTVIGGKIISEDPYGYYGVSETFKITKLWCLDWVKWGRIGFLVQTLSFALSTLFFAINKKGNFYTRDELIVVLMRVLGKKVFWEAHMGHANVFVRLVLWLKIPVIAITNGLKQSYGAEKSQEYKFLVAPDAVNINKFIFPLSRAQAREKLGFSSDEKIILYSGHLYHWKGVETLAEAARLGKNGWRFVFLGGSNKHIEDFKRRHGEIENIRILGGKPLNEIPIYLKAADVLVLPNSAKEEISRLYTSPMKLFEYMASGTPIVASDLPSLREILDESQAHFFEADNPENLILIIAKVLESEGEASERSAMALEKVKNYSWEERSRKILEFIS
jgi:glycosyltransferase involved in cell wall biosynthesis